MKFRRIAILAVPVAILGAAGAATTVAFASHGGGMCHGARHDAPASAEELRAHMDQGIDRMERKLDLSDAQRAEVEAIADRVAPAAFDLGEEGRSLREEAHELMGAERIDRQALDTVRTDAVDLFDRATRLGMDAIVDVASVLDDDQRAQVREMVERHHR